MEKDFVLHRYMLGLQLRHDEIKTDVLDLKYFGLIHLKISSLAAGVTEKFAHNNNNKNLVSMIMTDGHRRS
jgi:hypothetical protein